MQVGFFLDGFRRILLRLGMKRETVNALQLPFSFIYAGLTGFSVSVVRSLVQKLLAQQGLTRLDNFALTLMVLFILMPNFSSDSRRCLVLRLCLFDFYDGF